MEKPAAQGCPAASSEQIQQWQVSLGGLEKRYKDFLRSVRGSEQESFSNENKTTIAELKSEIKNLKKVLSGFAGRGPTQLLTRLALLELNVDRHSQDVNAQDFKAWIGMEPLKELPEMQKKLELPNCPEFPLTS